MSRFHSVVRTAVITTVLLLVGVFVGSTYYTGSNVTKMRR
jgi:hypothetical protein